MQSEKLPFGVTLHRRTQRFIAQLWIGGAPRHFGRFDSSEEAGKAVDNALMFLAEFFPERRELNFGIEDHSEAWERTERVRDKLIAEGAPRYRQEGTQSERPRLLAELAKAQEQLAEVAKRIGNLVKSLEVAQ